MQHDDTSKKSWREPDELIIDPVGRGTSTPTSSAPARPRPDTSEKTTLSTCERMEHERRRESDGEAGDHDDGVESGHTETTDAAAPVGRASAERGVCPFWDRRTSEYGPPDITCQS